MDRNENGEAGPCRICYVVPDDRHIVHWTPNRPTQELRFYVPPPEGNPFK